MALLLIGGGLAKAEPEKKPLKELPSFGTLRATAPDAARSQAQDWLKSVGKSDAATLKQFNAVWDADRPVLDKVAQTLTLGDKHAAKLLEEARDPSTPAPTEVPSILKDTKLPAYFRANLALAYAKALCNRKVYEEALEAFKSVGPEQVVDPASFLFHKAVVEHALMQKDQAADTIDRLLVDVPDAPERYRMVGALMHFDMLTWKDKDLGWISRKMENIHRRLDLVRGGKQTQQMEKEVLVRLDEMIKELENQCKCSGSCCNGGNCPGGGQNPSNNIQSSSPQRDSIGGNGGGKGQVDLKKVKEIADVWGTLPEKERAKAMVELTRGMPAKYRDAIEAYFKELQSKSTSR
jgi:tetratricopeptide (TPR) repeat protein